ncbi:glycosyltransferase [Candidatus Daviesbacteria bacterium]|nr:glycosyltransferase [Candidatus Daviesbacteria bacterium]
MKVALVHDDLVQWGGAERVLLGLCEIFEDAPIYTSVVDFSHPILNKKFKNKKILTSFIQKIPYWKNFYKSFLPLYPIAFEQFDFSKYDCVISNTTRFAKVIISKPQTIHISYCHTPPRFLWNFSEDKQSFLSDKQSFSASKSLQFFPSYLHFLKKYDQISANRVDYFVAGSKNASLRIKDIYKKDSDVIVPFVDDKFFNSGENFEGDYYLIVSRLNKYKKVDLAVDVFNDLGKRLIIVGSGPMLSLLKNKANSNIEFIENITDEFLIKLLSGTKALLILGEEDFGLSSLESQAMGKPVIAFQKGGVLETVIDSQTGLFFREQTKTSLKEAIQKFESLEFDKEKCIKNASKFSFENFKSQFLEIVLKLT